MNMGLILEKDGKQFEVQPSIIVPDRSFLVGSVYGLNAGRRLQSEHIEPIVGDKEVTDEECEGLYMGHWLELTCGKCGALYTFNNANELPPENLVCTMKGCGNHIIVYGIGDPRFWVLGQIPLG